MSRRKLTADEKIEVRVWQRTEKWTPAMVAAADVLYQKAPGKLAESLQMMGWKADEIEATLNTAHVVGGVAQLANAIASAGRSPEADATRAAMMEEAGFSSRLTQAAQDPAVIATGAALRDVLAQTRAVEEATGRWRPHGPDNTRAQILDAASAMHGLPRGLFEEGVDAARDASMQHDLAMRFFRRDREVKDVIREKPARTHVEKAVARRAERRDLRADLERVWGPGRDGAKGPGAVRGQERRRESEAYRARVHDEEAMLRNEPARHPEPVSRPPEREPSDAVPDTSGLDLRESLEMNYNVVEAGD